MPLVINGEHVEDSVIDQERSYLRHRFSDACESMQPSEAEEWLKNLATHNVVSRVLLRQEAWKDPAAIADEVLLEAVEGCGTGRPVSDSARRDAEERLRLEQLIAYITADVKRLNRKEIDLYYKTHRSQFAAAERISVRHIVKNVDETIDPAVAREALGQAAQELEQGAQFGEVADRHSDCPGNGGDLGWFERGAMVEEFEEVIFGLPLLEISPIFQTRFGFHVAQVLDRKPAGIRPLGEIREQLAGMLYAERKQKRISQFVDQLAGTAQIEFLGRLAGSRA